MTVEHQKSSYKQWTSTSDTRQLQILANGYAQQHLTNTILSFKNTLDWLTGETDVVEASSTLIKSR